jgi:two-component system OmpR family response regulator
VNRRRVVEAISVSAQELTACSCIATGRSSPRRFESGRFISNLLRVQAILRRVTSAPVLLEQEVLRFHDLELDDTVHEVRRVGRTVGLSPTEFKLLRYLMVNAGKVVSKDQILDRVWSYDFGGSGRIVESYIYYLRKKIDMVDSPLIHTVRGFGYALRLPRADQ